MRILPEIWASTLCPLSNSTRNIALGSVSSTVPVTSMASCFGIKPGPICARHSLQLTQYVGSVFGNRHGVLEMGRQATIFRHRRPTIFLNLNLMASGVPHRFDRQHHAVF